MCEMRRLADGSIVPKCRRCGTPAGLLCDGPHDPSLGHWHDDEGKGRCSMPLCQGHAFTNESGDKHYCWHHRALAGAVA
jgi:hypothetical protein